MKRWTDYITFDIITSGSDGFVSFYKILKSMAAKSFVLPGQMKPVCLLPTQTFLRSTFAPPLLNLRSMSNG